MPRLERVHVPGLDSLGPERLPAHVAVSPTGRLVFTGAFDAEQRLFTVVDTTGALLARFGRSGDGPGEIRTSPWLLAFDDTTIVASDVDLDRFVAYTTDGRHRWTTATLAERGPVVRLTTDSADIAVMRVEQGVWRQEYRRVALPSLRGRVLIPASDTVAFRLSYREGLPPSRRTYRGVAYGAGPGTLVLGESFTYRLQFYDSASGTPGDTLRRELPPRRRTPREIEAARRSLERSARMGFVGPDGRRVPLPIDAADFARLPLDTLRHFRLASSLHFDARGRLWVIGQVNDSVFADAFAGTRWLGRQMLPCWHDHLQPSLNGTWLALACATPDAPERDVELQVYRIREPEE